MRYKHEYYIFHDESGEPGRDEFFLSGLLFTTPFHARQLHKLIIKTRHNHKLWDEMHFEKFSKLKHCFYQDVLTKSLEIPWSYSVIVVPKSLLILSRFGTSKRIAKFRAYNFFTKLLLIKRFGYYPGVTLFFSDKRNRLKIDNFQTYLTTEVNSESFLAGQNSYISQVLSLDLKQVQQLQLVDLITGLISSNIKSGASGRKMTLAQTMMGKRGFRRRLNIWLWRPRN